MQVELNLGGIQLGKYFITGDMHGDFLRLVYFTDEFQTTIADTMIILGDAGINFSGEAYDDKKRVNFKDSYHTVLRSW